MLQLSLKVFDVFLEVNILEPCMVAAQFDSLQNFSTLFVTEFIRRYLQVCFLYYGHIFPCILLIETGNSGSVYAQIMYLSKYFVHLLKLYIVPVYHDMNPVF